MSRATDGVLDDSSFRNDLHPVCSMVGDADRRLTVLSWGAQDAVAVDEHIQLVLQGTLVSSSYNTSTSKRMKVASSSSLVMLNGKSGILELIANYAGTPKAQEFGVYYL